MTDDRPDGWTFPTREALLGFLRDADGPVRQKELAKAFHIRGGDRAALKILLRQMIRESALHDEGKQGYVVGPDKAAALPPVTVLEVADIDEDGELLARPASWHREAEPPRIYLSPGRRGHPSLGKGDRVLARLKPADDGSYEAEPIRVLGGAPKLVLGVFRRGERGGRLEPTDRRVKSEFVLHEADSAGASPGELVLVEVKPRQNRLGLREVRVRERLGALGETGNFSLISAVEHDLPMEFDRNALAEAEAAGPAELGRRRDLREIPLVTIDGADARDFDDAVWAAPDPDPGNPEGWHILVAIADVAHYVRPGGALDRTARRRGNSTYFPDRVIPMLPEAISNGWCSLVPGEERPCLAVDLFVDRDGELRRYRFHRGLMRSASRLTYEQVQAARDGAPDAAVAPLVEPVIAPLYGAFEALLRARANRGTLDLELAEKQISVDQGGRVVSIEPRVRLDSHRLIEEMMIAANVAAADAMGARQVPGIYRVHDQPDPAKLDALRPLLESFGLQLARGQVIRPRHFQRLLEQAAGEPWAPALNEAVLRAQSQAVYAGENRGHFGLALTKYTHFTSPIRRYADLVVHRALIAAYGLGGRDEPGKAEADWAGMVEIAEQVSMTERRSQAAERDAEDRFIAAFLSSRIGQVFSGRVTGVTRFGLFVQVEQFGADGLVPVSTLPDDRYDHDAAAHALIGRRWGRCYRLGDAAEVRIVEAKPITGGIVFELLGTTAVGERPSASPISGGGPGRGPRGARNRGSGRPGRSPGRQRRRH